MPKHNAKNLANLAKSTSLKQPSKTNLKGKIGEDKACAWLESRGFKILERNFYTRFGEIDIIALEELGQDSILHFIEVKNYTRSLPIYAITPKKLAKIYQSIEVYFFTQNQQNTQLNAQSNDLAQITNENLNICLNSLPYCVSAVLIQSKNVEKISFLPNLSQNF